MLHLGNLQTALLSWLQARQAGGVWLLRIDDLDTPRNRARCHRGDPGDLRWLGLDWDGPVMLQSERRGHLRVLAVLVAPIRMVCSPAAVPEGSLPVSVSLSRRLPRWEGTTGGGSSSGCPAGACGCPDDDPDGSGDVVVRRADGFIAYQLATVIDELASASPMWCAVLICARPCQPSAVSFAALGESPPQFRMGRCCVMPAARNCPSVRPVPGLEPSAVPRGSMRLR